jgi:tRNA(fMet)-specific endonuclease VapC
VTFLFDTNAWIALFRQNNAALLRRMQQHSHDEIALCSIVLAELWFGVFRSSPTHRATNGNLIEQLCARHKSLPFDDTAAKEYAGIRAILSAGGQMIGPNDLMIASVAVSNGLTLVSHNTSEFGRIPGLLLEDWQNP